jgi:hypothetical protein
LSTASLAKRASHLSLPAVDAGARRGIISIRAPGWMVEVQYEIAVVRSSDIIERQSADAAPVAERTTLSESWSIDFTVIGYFYVEPERSFGNGVARIENLPHDFVAEIEPLTLKFQYKFQM